MEKIQELLTTIGPVIGTIIAASGILWGIFKQDDNLYDEYVGKYYTEILEPLISRIIKNDLNIESEYMDLGISKYHYMPTYINYMVHLINKGSKKYTWEDLKKIIIVDYLANRPSSSNAFFKGLDKLNRKTLCIGNLITIGIMIIEVVCIGVIFFMGILITAQIMIKQAKIKDLLYIVVAIIIFIIVLVLLRNTVTGANDDLYTKSVRKIERTIKERLKFYKEMEKQYKKYNPEINSSELLFLDMRKLVKEDESTPIVDKDRHR